MKTTEQKNRMIAEFMGLEPLSSDPKNFFFYRPLSNYIYTKSMQYNTSWDWLMPVVEAIYNTGLDEQNTNEIGDVTHALLDVNINAVHEAVVQFIEWYNEQKF